MSPEEFAAALKKHGCDIPEFPEEHITVPGMSIAVGKHIYPLSHVVKTYVSLERLAELRLAHIAQDQLLLDTIKQRYTGGQITSAEARTALGNVNYRDTYAVGVVCRAVTNEIEQYGMQAAHPDLAKRLSEAAQTLQDRLNKFINYELTGAAIKTRGRPIKQTGAAA